MWTHGSHVWLLGLTAYVGYQKETGNANSVLLNEIYIERSGMVQNTLLGYPWCVLMTDMDYYIRKLGTARLDKLPV
jgi:hypothetical protein